MMEKFNKKRDDSHLNLKRQAMDDALRKWEAQIDQLRSEEHESLPETTPGRLTILCSVDIFSINAIADLGASINIMSESMFDELSLADPKHANIIVEMADKTREVSLGIKEDKVKIKMKEQKCNTAVDEHLNTRPTSRAGLSHGAVNKTHWCEHVRQEHGKGYTLWASCDPYYEICDGGGISDKNLKHFWKSRNNDDRITLEWEGLSCTNWLGGQIREKTLTEEQEDPEKCGETNERAIIGAVVNKLPEEWFSEISRDKDDLEGIIDYLEPTLYEGFIDHNDEAYKQRRNKLLGIPYIEPPQIKKEEAKITKYNLGAGEPVLMGVRSVGGQDMAPQRCVQMVQVQLQETNSGLVLKLKGSKQSHIKVHFKGIIAKVQYQRFKYQRDHSKGSISKVQISKVQISKVQISKVQISKVA
ncbi:RNA-directed DNA polymerase, eukaryota, reverse transcriptase zinc-binding domain protein [Tanacetum coccineum]